MQTITITELRRHLSEYAARAAAGERFMILRRSRPLAALVSARDLKGLVSMNQMTTTLARALGQDADLLRQISAGKVHPAMAAAGLWKDEEDLSNLDQRVLENRRAFSSRAKIIES